jgi:hypothetical protein
VCVYSEKEDVGRRGQERVSGGSGTGCRVFAGFARPQARGMFIDRSCRCVTLS